MQDVIERIWWNRREDRAHGWMYLLRLLLIPFSVLYGWAVDLRNLLFDLEIRATRRAGRPTISVGNLTVGGTGKTPFVESLARDLASKGQHVGILSRGYGEVEEGDDEELSSQDEACSIRRWTHPKRLEAARQAMEQDPPDLFLMDDGFQHRQMSRDLDVVLVDGLRVFGNGYPLPAGPLREPIRHIRRADLVVITRSNRMEERALRGLQDELEEHLSSEVPVLQAEHRPIRIVRWNTSNEVSRESLQNRKLLAFCGIGTPDSFRHTLQDDLDLEPVAFQTYPDHHVYSSNDRAELIERAKKQEVDYLITTRKDAVKWPDEPSFPLLCVDVDIRVTRGADVLQQHLSQVLDSE